MSSSPQAALAALELTEEELVKTAGLLNLVWPDAKHLDKAYLDWEYVRNPEGPALGRNAWLGAELIAHYVTQPIRAMLNGKEERGLLSINSAVHPQHRGRNFFKILAKQTYENASSQGYSFVIGVSNQYSTLLFIRQLGFQLVGPLDVRIGLGQVRRYLTQAEPSFYRIWQKGQLAWRLSPPGNHYRHKKNGDSLNVYAPTKKYGIWAELACLAAEFSTEHIPVLRSLNPLKLWIGRDSSCDWKKSVYFPLPERFRPSPLNLIFKDLTNQKRKIDKNSISFSLLDFDAY